MMYDFHPHTSNPTSSLVESTSRIPPILLAIRILLSLFKSAKDMKNI